MRLLPSFFLLLLTLCACSPKVTAPLFGTETGRFGASFDHYAINVDALDESVRFYQTVFDLEEVYDGTEKPNIRWLSLGNGMSLHVIEAENETVVTQKGIHLAISVGEFDRFVEHLRRLKIQFWSWQGVPMQSNGRPDGVNQVYVKDPDGYWIEVNDGRKILNKSGAE